MSCDSNETFHLTPDEESRLLESLAEADRGETVSAESLIRDLGTGTFSC